MLSVLLASCTTTPTHFSQLQEGQWRAKVLIRDKARNKSHIVYVDVMAVRPEKLRMEVTSPIGIHLASFAMNNGKVEYLLTRRKEFYRGRTSSENLQEVLQMPIDPRLLTKILFDEDLSGQGWQCKRDKKGFLSACEDDGQDLKLTWSNRERSRRTITFFTPKARVQMLLKGFKAKVEAKGNLFRLQAPKNFKVRRI